MNIYLIDPVPPFAPDKSTAYASFTTKQDCSPRPIPVIPANRLRVGSMIKIEAEGEYSTTATPTLAWGLYIGSHDGTTGTAPTITTDIALSSVITTPSGAAAFHWRMEWRGKVTKTGTSGSMIGTGDLEQGITITTESTFPIPITAALRTVAIDTTIDRAVGVSATYSASSASNTFTTYSITVMVWGGTA